MTPIKKRLSLITLCLLLWATPALSEDLSKSFYEGISHYEAGRYEEALSQFLAVSEEGIQNGKLDYNIGNTYMQMGDVGRALLWYERADRLIPGDPDLIFNRDVALRKVKDKQEVSESLLISVLFFWKDGLSLATLQWLAVGGGVLFWALLAIAMITRRSAVKASALCVGIVVGIFTVTALWDTAADSSLNDGVVLDSSVSVRSGLSETSTELFTLHAGSFVTIDQSRNGWLRIAFSQGKIGWVAESSIGRI